jgi:glutaredoxin
MTRLWGTPVLLAVCGAVAGVLLMLRGDVASGIAFLVGFCVLAGTHSPLVFPRSVTAQEARRRSEADGRPVVYWRPGCAYCLRLRARLGRGGRKAHWVNIWRDPAGAAAVREVNDGNETVPTVVVAGTAYTNPEPAWLRQQLARGAR